MNEKVLKENPGEGLYKERYEIEEQIRLLDKQLDPYTSVIIDKIKNLFFNIIWCGALCYNN